MKLDNIHKVYLVGIGGIGMSGLARYFHQNGCLVNGYDKTETLLTLALVAEGIDVNYEDSIKNIPNNFQTNSESTLIIYTPAIPAGSEILQFFIQNGFTVKKRSQVLGILSEGMCTIAVAGTHGKTTTSCLIAHILKSSGNDCSAFLGGLSSNYNTNILIGKNNVMVVEADEYDRSFLTLHPDIAIVTSMDADHLDIYGDADHLKQSFQLFASQIKPNGKLIRKAGLDLNGGKTYWINTKADAIAENIHVENGTFVFDFRNENIELKDLILGLPGQHNIENAVAAIEVALLMDINVDRIREALHSFKGVKRRFEYQLNADKIYVDDYAHHPEELRAFFKAIRTLYPDRKLTAIFQPHLFTRTRDFADGFAEVLSTVDDLLLLEIYPARELPIPNVNSQMLIDKITLKNKRICSKQQAMDYVKEQQPQLLVTVGAGDIDTLVEPLKNLLQNA
jgi:UDP-N-acetylmuramate--alanine ligase